MRRIIVLVMLVSVVWAAVFPNGDFFLWEFPREVGRMGSAEAIAAIFEKTCFEPSVGVWSA